MFAQNKRGYKKEVSLIAGAVGFAATAAAVATVGAGAMAVGAVTGIKPLQQVGGLMMAGGAIASGLGGLGMVGGVAGASTGLGTLAAGASLVGGAMQGVGILTGNNKMAAIGGLLGGAGMMGTSSLSTPTSSFDPSGLSSSQIEAMGGAANIPTDMASMTPTQIEALGGAANIPMKMGNLSVAGGVATTSNAAPLVDSMAKYDKLIGLGSAIATTMSASKTANDKLAQDQAQYNQTLAFQQQQHPNGQFQGTIPVSAPATQQYAQRATTLPRGMLNTSLNSPVPGVN